MSKENGELTIVGLGTGSAEQLTLGAWRLLKQASEVYVRTGDHPVLEDLRAEGASFSTFDYIYEQQSSFPDVYQEITRVLLERAKQAEGAVVYGVPGHPMVAEQTVQLLRSGCEREGIHLRILGGESFLDQAFIAFGFDPIEGFSLVDASGLQASSVPAGQHLIIGQVYDRFTASDVKLALMERFGDDYEVVAGHYLGIPGKESIVRLPLYELDRSDAYSNHSLIYVPRLAEGQEDNRSLERLHEIVAILRSPEGCPWDKEQTHQSIRSNFIEEVAEVLQAIDNDDVDNMQEELGDVLLQVMMHSQMEEEVGAFTIYDVIEALNQKLLYRHPHVFGDQAAGDASEALGHWEAMKAAEKQSKQQTGEQVSLLDNIPESLTALLTAKKLQKKAKQVGFDWDTIEPVLDKIAEELEELREAIKLGTAEQQAGELGDLLFATVNAARFIKADPELALTSTNQKFRKRFQYIEEQLRIAGKSFDQTDLIEMDKWWEEAKSLN